MILWPSGRDIDGCRLDLLHHTPHPIQAPLAGPASLTGIASAAARQSLIDSIAGSSSSNVVHRRGLALHALSLEFLIEVEHGSLVGACVQVACAAAAGGVSVGVGRVVGCRVGQTRCCEAGGWWSNACGVAGTTTTIGHLVGGGRVRFGETDGHFVD